MVNLLLLFSFIIHVVTLIIIRQMKIKQKSMEDIEANVYEQIDKMENTLALYLVEMREENEHFTKELLAIQEKREQYNNQAPSDENLNKNAFKEEKTITKENNYAKFTPLTNVEQEDVMEQSDTAKILHLSKNGYTTDEIARKLDKGKTEIELLLKFQQKNQ
ncbi:hypothetical protein SAMN04487944_101127 [Gracilibacillus ureilyticus]|uniref:Coupling factor for flagellin transcription and translation n=1 Tax=Gracilibacillus ureilyticus TaxID=531814 RepID=A0A1H9L7X9_9BACI|nr:hypothetical protein [Gracilibacillus ureilyticus]SER07103.1 hypothetical protein SAMN04487944_101127 [Gracilibacillus ureilyticus]